MADDTKARFIPSAEDTAAQAGRSDAEHAGATIRAAREKKGWTIRTLAKRTGYNVNTVGLCERGTRTSQAIVQRCCDALGILLPTGYEALSAGHAPHAAPQGRRKPAKAKAAPVPKADPSDVIRVREVPVVLGATLDPSELSNTTETMHHGARLAVLGLLKDGTLTVEQAAKALAKIR
jgi:transcriptional regulator with XRE-family HTH domain